MASSDLDYTFPEPWLDIRGDDPENERRRRAMEDELTKEIGHEHPLVGVAPRAVAMFTRQDDVLFRSTDGSYAIVHLTWKGAQDHWVVVRPFSHWDAARAEVEQMSEFL